MARSTKTAPSEELASWVPLDCFRHHLHNTIINAAHTYEAVQIVQPTHKALDADKPADTEEGLKDFS